ncbi:exopolysaccharide production repressor protein [Rhizobium binxianense]
MYAPRVFFSMVFALLIFAGVSFFLVQSVWTVLIQTVVAAILLQVGYFGGVLFLVWKAAKERNTGSQSIKPMTKKEKLPDGPAAAPKKF